MPSSASVLVLHEIRTLSQFGTGSQLFLKMPVCSVSNDILLTGNVAFIILQMSDFSRLPLDVYVFTRYGYNIKKIQTQRGHNKAMVMVHILKINEIEKILCLFDSKTWGLCQERIKFTRFILR